MKIFESFYFWLFLYAGIVLWVSLIRGPKTKTLSDWLSASAKPLHLPILIFTFAATLFSAFFMVGIPAFVLTHGIGTWPYIVFGDVLGMFGLFIVGRKILQEIRHNEILSPLKLFSSSSIYSILFILVTATFIMPYLSIQIAGFGKLVNSATDGKIPQAAGMVIVLLIIYFYSHFAGFRGIAYSDFVQGLLLFITSMFVAIFLVIVEFEGITDMFNKAYQSSPLLFSLPGPKKLFSHAALFSYCIMFAAIPITQPQFLTRFLSIKRTDPDKNSLENYKMSIRYLRNISIGFGLLLCFGSLAALLIGLSGSILYPEIKDGDKLLGTILSNSFPNIFSRIVSIGVLAAAMSTADSILFSMGQMFSIDIYRELLSKEHDDRREKIICKTFMLAVIVVAFLIALNSTQGLIVTLSKLSFAGMLQLLPSIIGGLWLKKAWRYAGVFSVIGGIASFLFLLRTDRTFFLGLDPAIGGLFAGSIIYLVTAQVGIRKSE